MSSASDLWVPAAVRHIARNKLACLADVAGLALGLAVALAVSLFIADELSYEDFIPDAAHVFRISSNSKRSNLALSTSQKQVASLLELDYPQVKSVTRLLDDKRGVRHGEVESNEKLYWVDTNLFSTMALPTVFGNASTAFDRPSAVVITQRLARKYFGRENVVGETLELDRQHRLIVSAVLRDLPRTTHLDTEMLVAGTAAFSRLRTLDIEFPGSLIAPVHTYFRLEPGADIANLRRDMPAFIDRHWPGAAAMPNSRLLGFTLLSLPDIHLHSNGLFSMRPPGDRAALLALGLVAFLIAGAACINFVNMTAARSTRRRLEVGVRKCMGASRWHLVVQFLGESTAVVLVAFVCAIGLVAAALPAFNALLDTDLAFHPWSHPWAMGGMFLGMLSIGTLANLYPALILSAFRAADVVRAGSGMRSGNGRLLNALVVIQFAALIGLLMVTGTIRAQMNYAMGRGTGVGGDPVIIVRTNCEGAFPQAIRDLAGVRGAACSQSAPTNYDRRGTSATRSTGAEPLQIDLSVVDFDFFDLYDIRPLAGRLFSRDFVTDSVSGDRSEPFHASLILNEAATRKFGFGAPAEAIGKELKLRHVKNAQFSRIVGVVPDFPVDSLREPVAATAYYIDPGEYRLLSIGLRKEGLAATLAAIDRLWDETSGTGRPISRSFIDDYLNQLYAQVRVQSELLAVLTGIAICIGCAGISGLAAFAAQRRTREIGVRKALGASNGDIVRLLAWQFVKPVLLANLIAWPVAELVLSRWLEGFAYHTSVSYLWLAACSALSVGIAFAVVSIRVCLSARAKPVQALRYE